MDTPDAGPRSPVRPAPGAAAPSEAARGPAWARAFLLVVPAVWLGLVIGISLIEAPLKFTAPGITIPLGLGIGRRVFFAMNLLEVVLAVLLLVALWRSVGRPGGNRLWVLGWVCVAMLVLKAAVIRPFLNQRTDAVLAGDFAGGSMTHYFYVGAEAILILALVLLLLSAARAVVGRDRPE